MVVGVMGGGGGEEKEERVVAVGSGRSRKEVTEGVSVEGESAVQWFGSRAGTAGADERETSGGWGGGEVPQVGSVRRTGRIVESAGLAHGSTGEAVIEPGSSVR